MSSQKGNVSRTRPQKHKNRTVFKNNLHDTSNQTKFINSIQVGDVCARCKEIIEWKIKYKKYKPLKQPRTCVKCSQKTVKQAYHVMCKDCGIKLELCTKCCQRKDILDTPPTPNEQVILDNELKELIKSLPERKRRTFLRYLNQKSKKSNAETADNSVNPNQTQNDNKEDLLKKIAELKMNSNNDEEEDADLSDEFDLDDEFDSDEENSDDL